MAFDTSVSGILSASADLGIIGNNIANASTTGFKQSVANSPTSTQPRCSERRAPRLVKV